MHRGLAGEALDGEQRLILLGGHACVLGVHIAEGKEQSQPVTKLGKSFEVDGVSRLSVAPFAAHRFARPRYFSLLWPNHSSPYVVSLPTRAARRRRRKPRCSRLAFADPGAGTLTIPLCPQKRRLFARGTDQLQDYLLKRDRNSGVPAARRVLQRFRHFGFGDFPGRKPRNRFMPHGG
jgi:hypothetical protein